MTDQKRYARFLERAGHRLLHPTQILIVKTILASGKPVSATIMKRETGGRIRLANFDYHLSRLADLGLVKEVDRIRRRGTFEKFFNLVEEDE